MEEKEEKEVERLRNNYLELKKKKSKISFSLPYRLKFPIAWTIFFAVIGKIQQSIISGQLIFLQFFTTGYVEWFHLFSSYGEIYKNSGVQQVIVTVLRTWYYFFFTGGLVSIIWAIIATIVNSEPKIRKGDFS